MFPFLKLFNNHVFFIKCSDPSFQLPVIPPSPVTSSSNQPISLGRSSLTGNAASSSSIVVANTPMSLLWGGLRRSNSSNNPNTPISNAGGFDTPASPTLTNGSGRNRSKSSLSESNGASFHGSRSISISSMGSANINRYENTPRSPKPVLSSSLEHTPASRSSNRRKSSFSPLIVGNNTFTMGSSTGIPPPFALDSSSFETSPSAVSGDKRSGRRKRSQQYSDLDAFSTSLKEVSNSSSRISPDNDIYSGSPLGFFGVLSNQSLREKYVSCNNSAFSSSSISVSTSSGSHDSCTLGSPNTLKNPVQSGSVEADFMMFELDDNGPSSKAESKKMHSPLSSIQSVKRRLSIPTGGAVESSPLAKNFASSSLPDSAAGSNRMQQRSRRNTAEICYQKIDKKLRKQFKKQMVKSGDTNVSLSKMRWIERQLCKLYYLTLRNRYENGSVATDSGGKSPVMGLEEEEQFVWKRICDLGAWTEPECSSTASKKKNQALLPDSSKRPFLIQETFLGGSIGDQACRCLIGAKDEILNLIGNNRGKGIGGIFNSSASGSSSGNGNGRKSGGKQGNRKGKQVVRDVTDSLVCVFEMNDSFSRMMIHIIGQYFPFCRSESKDIQGQRLTVLQLQREKSTIKLCSIPTIELASYFSD